MKKYILLLCLFTTPALANKLEMNCESVKSKSMLSYIASFGQQKIVRCENEEVICYVTLGDTNDYLNCKFK